MRINLKSVGVILADHMLQLLLKKSETEGKGDLAESRFGKVTEHFNFTYFPLFFEK